MKKMEYILESNPARVEPSDYDSRIVNSVWTAESFALFSAVYSNTGRFDLIGHMAKGIAAYSFFKYGLKGSKKTSMCLTGVLSLGYELFQGLTHSGEPDLTDILLGDITGAFILAFL